MERRDTETLFAFAILASYGFFLIYSLTKDMSPKRDWKAGDLRGVLSISVPLHGIRASIEKSFQYLLLYFLIGGVVLISAVIWALGRE